MSAMSNPYPALRYAPVPTPTSRRRPLSRLLRSASSLQRLCRHPLPLCTSSVTPYRSPAFVSQQGLFQLDCWLLRGLRQLKVSKDYQSPLPFLGPAPQTATATTDNRVIVVGDQTGVARTNRQVETTTRRINRTSQNTADNLKNRRVTRSMVRRGLAQLWPIGESLCVGADDDWSSRQNAGFLSSNTTYYGNE